jgi:hypothetical protein
VIEHWINADFSFGDVPITGRLAVLSIGLTILCKFINGVFMRSTVLLNPGSLNSLVITRSTRFSHCASEALL